MYSGQVSVVALALVLFVYQKFVYLRHALQLLDENGDGIVNDYELHSYYSNYEPVLGLKELIPDMDDVLLSVDTNKDSKISTDEICHYIYSRSHLDYVDNIIGGLALYIIAAAYLTWINRKPSIGRHRPYQHIKFHQ